jgi:hypothetical protein
MKCACGCNGLSATLVVVGLGALGLGGYNLITTGCPLGSCGDTAGNAPVITPAAADARSRADRRPLDSVCSTPCAAQKSECPLADKPAECEKSPEQKAAEPADVTVHVAPPATAKPGV